MMTAEADDIFQRSIRNREALEKADRCGCYFCETIYSPKEINDWADNGETAICPHCNIDAVVAETDDFKVTEQILSEGKEEWF